MYTLSLGEDYLAIVTIGVSELIYLISNYEEWLMDWIFMLKTVPLP
jgi:neutral amino acid transport system permease protein